MSLRPLAINDEMNAMKRNKTCNVKPFMHYRSYEVIVTPLGTEGAPGPNDCDQSSPRFNGSCNSDMGVAFTSLLNTVYTSGHGTNWIDILTAEGGIVGFVTFLTWFFGIFEM